jgi:predicted RNA methylase
VLPTPLPLRRLIPASGGYLPLYNTGGRAISSNSKFDFVIDSAKTAFDGRVPVFNTRLPYTQTNGEKGPPFVVASALWTRDGLRPQWSNLAAVATVVDGVENFPRWNNVLTSLRIPLGIYILADSLFLAAPVGTGHAQAHQIEPETLSVELTRRNSELFTPRSLAPLRKGQMLLADLEEGVTRGSFSFHTRYHAQLAHALQSAITDAFTEELEVRRKSQELSNTEASAIYDSILIVAIAFLAARILEDKNFFGADQMPTDNVEELLVRMLKKKNGFFKKALEELSGLNVVSVQRLAVHLGSRATFSIVDHHDIAEIYEKAIRNPILPKELELEDFESLLARLEQHYTPLPIAERMLELLPLERLRPTDRRIFDPAAGSGTLLLAATERLSTMTDIPGDMSSYLGNQVAGNDLDSNANLITQVRYTLTQYSEGSILPGPRHFSSDDFEHYTKENLPTKPRVIIANPPFGGDSGVQKAARFLELMMDWLGDDDQFAVILPHSFLTGTMYGFSPARRRLAERCHLFEVWQLPEGSIGEVARQPVCVVLGCIGRPRQARTVLHSTISGAMVKAVREIGFLGQTWMGEVDQETNDWKSLLSPPVPILVDTVPLKSLYYMFIGVLRSTFPPLNQAEKDAEKDIIVKRYWRLGFREDGRLWADPQKVDEKEQYIRYGKAWLKTPRLKDAKLYDRPKLMVGRSVNRNAVDPIAACLDTTGFCPNNDVYCITTWDAKGEPEGATSNPPTWAALNEEDKHLWLLGILTSKTARQLSLTGRGARHVALSTWENFPIPTVVDQRIISVVRQMVSRDQSREPLQVPDPLRVQLDELVAETYGYPDILHMQLTGVDPEFADTVNELQRPGITVTGQIRKVSLVQRRVLLFLHGLKDEIDEAWIPVPPEVPGWALNGDVFVAELSDDILTFSQLAERPRALRNFRHTPRPYLTIEELKQKFTSTQ